MPAIEIIDLLWGDGGKGAAVDFFTAATGAKWNVRWNGGGQAAHNVIANGKHMTFHMFGSGSMAGANTFLSADCVVSPWVILHDIFALLPIETKDWEEHLYIHEDSLITSEFQLRAARDWMRENPGKSTGMGVWETKDLYRVDPDAAISMKDCSSKRTLGKKLKKQLEYYQLNTFCTIEYALDNLYSLSKKVKTVDTDWWESQLTDPKETFIFEMAQGRLLDKTIPDGTSTDCSDLPVNNLLKNYTGKRTKIGVIRAVSSRHGYGNFPTEDKRLSNLLVEAHNTNRHFEWRNGWLDLASAADSIAKFGAVDYLAVSHMDYLSKLDEWIVRLPGGVEISMLGNEPDSYLALIESVLQTPIITAAYGARREDREWVNYL